MAYGWIGAGAATVLAEPAERAEMAAALAGMVRAAEGC